jgi:hypothetical protein
MADDEATGAASAASAPAAPAPTSSLLPGLRPRLRRPPPEAAPANSRPVRRAAAAAQIKGVLGIAYSCGRCRQSKVRSRAFGSCRRGRGDDDVDVRERRGRVLPHHQLPAAMGGRRPRANRPLKLPPPTLPHRPNAAATCPARCVAACLTDGSSGRVGVTLHPPPPRSAARGL